MGRENHPILHKGQYYNPNDPNLPEEVNLSIADRDRAATDRTYRNDQKARAEALKGSGKPAPEEISQATGDEASAKANKGAETLPATDDAGKIGNVPEALPADFPSFQLLNNAGYTSLDKIMAAPDEELLKIKGVGAEKLAEIRKAIEES